MDERIEEDVLHSFSHVEGWKMTGLLRNSMSESLQVVAQRASHGRKRWSDTVKDCLIKKRERFGCQASKGKENGEWRGFVRGILEL